MKNLTPTDAARTASLALGRSPYSKGAEKLAADLGAKPTATLVNTRMEVPSPRNGRPAYRWVDGCYVVRPDGTKEFPPVRIREAWSRCASEGWAFKVVSESEYKEQTVTTQRTPKGWELRGLGTGDDLTIHDRDTDNGDTVATVPLTGDHEYDRDVTTANARLIAAAPELLEACIEALEVLDDCEARGMGKSPTAPILAAAIAKATKGGGGK